MFLLQFLLVKCVFALGSLVRSATAEDVDPAVALDDRDVAAELQVSGEA